jgi:hypothetical protein
MELGDFREILESRISELKEKSAKLKGSGMVGTERWRINRDILIELLRLWDILNQQK